MVLISSFCFGQKLVKIENIKQLNNDIFEAIKPYKILWLSEMHGANEPAHFAVGIVELFLKNNQKVTSGFETKESDVPTKSDSLSLVNSTLGKT
jgi:hypothetical protein